MKKEILIRVSKESHALIMESLNKRLYKCLLACEDLELKGMKEEAITVETAAKYINGVINEVERNSSEIEV